MKPRLERRQSTGFALIELLVSVLIISFGLLSLMALQTQVLRASIGSEDGQRAALLASEMAAAIVNAGTVNLPQFTIDKWTTKVGDSSKGGLPGGIGTITPDATGSSARIFVQWTQVGSTGPCTLR